MSTELQKQAELFKANGSELRTHALGDIMFFNTHLVTAKMLDICMTSLDDAGFESDGHGIFSVVFRADGYPMAQKDVLNSWAFSADACCAMCNIQHCIELAFEDSLDSKVEHSEKASVYMGVWKNMLKGFFHESYHAHSAVDEPYKLRFDKDYRAKDEETAPEFAKEQLFFLAKNIDIEMEFTQEVHDMITARLEAELARIEGDKKASKSDKAWAFHQKYLMENGGVFYAPPLKKDEDGLHLMTFKKYLHFFSNDAEDDEEWAADTIGIKPEVTVHPLNENADGNVPGTTVVDSVPNAAVEVEPFEYDNYDEMVDPEAGTPGFQGVEQVATAPIVNQTAPVNAPAPVAAPAPIAAPVVNQTAPVAPVAAAGPAVQLSADPQTVINGLYTKMFTQIFQGCQYSPTMPMAFPGGANITQWIELTEDESKLVVSMTCYSNDPNQRGVKVPNTPCDRHLCGILIDKAGTLPGYELTLMTPDGQTIRRNFFAQNPNKVGENGYVSEPAKMAKGGAQIMWIVDADTKEFKFRMVNGVMQKNLGNRQWG